MTFSRSWLALALLAPLAACSNPAAEPAPAAEAPADASIPWVPYVCADGRIVRALYPDTQTARLKVEGNDYRLKIAVSGSGARYVGEGLQWWTKGDEGMLSTLKAGESIAADPGVRCVPPARAPVEPPAPGTPGGLPDDRTPLNEGEARDPRPDSGQAAYAVLETYYALVESGRTADAARLRIDGREEDLKPFATLHAQVGGAGPVEGAAGSLYVSFPVVLYGRYATGGEYHRSGRATLRRVNNVPGATAEQLKWRIEKIELTSQPSASPPTR